MFKFLWYPDGTANPWQSWYDGQDSGVQGRHDIVVRFLELGHWKEPHYSVLKNADGLGEIRITGKVQHRLLGLKGDNAFLVLLTCTYKQKIYKPKDALDTAIRRGKEVRDGRSIAVECDKPKQTTRITAAKRIKKHKLRRS